MIVLSHRAALALAAVVDIAMHSRSHPVAAKALAVRLDLPPRHLETLLQSLVRANILKGLRGPRGGYELARERRKITAGAVLRAVLGDGTQHAEGSGGELLEKLIAPMIETVGAAVLKTLDDVTVEDICQKAETLQLRDGGAAGADFTI